MKISDLSQMYQTQSLVSQSTLSKETAVETKSEYEKILAEKIANARRTMELMNKVQSEIDFNNKLHEELTGKNPSNDDSNEETVKTIKRFMPDGSIMFVTLKDGEVVDMHKKKPHLVAVADPSAPKTPSGQTAVTLKVKPQLDLFSLLM